ncbi:MAG: AraC family transcriptional regulator ligand-binding domain-containing protein [Propionibacteriales bacterium]|nr:AraC family transcriptional regulator ligand-binding domain-containing protein [Propionibacteriales bacterium]
MEVVPPLNQRHPVLGTRMVCEVAEELGLAVTDVLAGTPLTPADLRSSDLEVAGEDEITAVRNLLALIAGTPDEVGIGVRVGMRATLANLGLFGFAVMVCPTLRDLMTVGLRFFSLTALHTSVTFSENAGRMTMTVDGGHLPEDVRMFFVEREVAGLFATLPPFINPVLAENADQVRVEIAAEASYLESLAALLPIDGISFGAERNQVSFPSSMLDAPLPQADPATLQVCVAQCEELIQRRTRRHGLAEEVRNLIVATPGSLASLPQVAAALDLHPRTLRRRLAEESTTFRDLLGEVRSALAAELIAQVGLSVEEAASRLGYSETAAFTRAFRTWYGMPPSQFRNAAVSGGASSALVARGGAHVSGGGGGI